MSLKAIAVVLCCLPLMAFGDSRMNQGKHTCHFIHDRAGNVETRLTPCYVTLNMYSPNRVYYAVGKAKRAGVGPGLIPINMAPPAEGCTRSRQWATVDCNVFDESGNAFKSREGGINVQVCKVSNPTGNIYDGGPYDIYYYLGCKNAFRLNKKQAMQMQEAETRILEATAVQDDTILPIE